MYYSRALYLVLTLLLSGAIVYGQTTMQVLHKYENNQLFIRWFPASGDAWEAVRSTGFFLQKYENGTLVSKSELPVKTAYLREYAPPYGDEDRFLLDRLFNLDKVDAAEVEESYPSDMFTPSLRNEARLATVNYLLSHDFSYTLEAGLGFLDEKITPGKNYRYVITPADPALTNDPTLNGSFSFNSKSYKSPPIPELVPDWDNRHVDLKWNTRQYKEYYYAYGVEKSSDGRNFVLIDSNIIVNPYDTSALKELQEIVMTDYFDNNEDLHYYRLYCYDYFGGRNKQYREVVGKGQLSIGLGPSIDNIEQLRGNKARLQWSVLDRFEHLVHHWDIYVSEAWEGPYIRDTSNIAAKVKEIKRPIRYGSTYFRVEAVDKQGRSYSSFPQMIMGLDTTPPARPIDISYTADTTGTIHLVWKKNYEKDFLGYKVFASYDSLHPFVLRHSFYLNLPEFSDSIGLRTEKKYIYYKIIAVDERNNRSPYSDMMRIPIPDILPPVEAQFEETRPGIGRIYLSWMPSPSEDAVSISLFRRNVDKEAGWKLLKTWPTQKMAYLYTDSTVVPLENYAYILQVKDASGLISPPGQPVVLSAFPDHRKFNADNFTVKWSVDEKNKRRKQVAIQFQFPWTEVFQVSLYRQKDEEQPSVLRAFNDPVSQYIDKDIEDGHQYHYFIRVTFHDGDQSPYSKHRMPQ